MESLEGSGCCHRVNRLTGYFLISKIIYPMILDDIVKDYIDRSVLCWLATSNQYNEPNVSPKEMFTWLDDETLLIAHIASPNSVNNIRLNPNVCVSLVDIFIQKGFKLKGTALIIEKTDTDFTSKLKQLTDRYSDRFPVQSLIEVRVNKVEPIKAPSYFLFPETTEISQVENAMKTYKVRPENS